MKIFSISYDFSNALRQGGDPFFSGHNVVSIPPRADFNIPVTPPAATTNSVSIPLRADFNTVNRTYNETSLLLSIPLRADFNLFLIR